MSEDVKRPKEPHRWGKIGQRVGQLRTVGPFSSTTVLFTDKEIASYLRAKTSRTCFQNSVISKYRVLGDEILHPELSPSSHTHTCTLTNLKKQLFCPFILKKLGTYSFRYAAYHLTSQYPSLGFHSLTQSARRIPTSRCPYPPHQAPAACG